MNASQIAPDKFLFLMMDDLSMIAFASVIEPLRLANRVAGREIFDWKLASENGVSVRCSNGVEIKVDQGLDALDRDRAIVVCSGLCVREHSSRPVLAWLRRESRKGMSVGAICTGTMTLAYAAVGRRVGPEHRALAFAFAVTITASTFKKYL